MVLSRISRRELLSKALPAVAAGFVPLELAIQPAGAAASAGVPFAPISPTKRDDLVVPEGFVYDVIARWGDPINDRGDTFGYNCDYTAYFPLSGKGRGRRTREAILAVNHEYTEPRMVGGQHVSPKSQAQVLAEMYSVGMAFIRIRQEGSGPWTLVKDDIYGRRITASSYPLKLTGPAAGSPLVGGSAWVAGSMGNCSGCRTPWDTVLSCEENYQDFYGEHSLIADGAGGLKEETVAANRQGIYRWHDAVPMDGRTGFAPAGGVVVRPEHYGYVMEVDPYSPQEPPRKHTAMGRFRHENVAMRPRPGQRVVAYMGDDRRSGHVYKFISQGVYREGPENREHNKRLLESGTLYVARFSTPAGPADSADDRGTGTWIPISNAIGQTDPVTRQPFTAASVLVHTFEAAQLVGGTPTDRPEDLEIHPQDGSVFIAFTNHIRVPEVKHGYIVRLEERDDDPEALTFTWDVFAYGGPRGDRPGAGGCGFSAPDNMVFDPRGNLWVVTDITSKSISGQGSAADFAAFGNNGVFYCPTKGSNAGKCYQFASAPVEAEATGPTWSPDHRSLFLAIQHPGEDSIDQGKAPTSHWPDGGTQPPKASVVAIRGFKPF